VVGNSEHRDEYVRLMRAGWTSLSLEAYARYRYAEDIPASTFRSYKARQKIEVKQSGLLSQVMDVDEAPDVIAVRQELIALQIGRIGIDVKHERDMSKLFSTTRGEIALLNSLLTDLKTDLQDAGLMGQATRGEDAVQPAQDGGVIPRAATLGDLMGLAPENQTEAARLLHLVLPPPVRPQNADAG
jgi:hypothetical protein